MNLQKYKEIFGELWAADIRFKIAVIAAVGFTAWGAFSSIQDFIAPPKASPPASSAPPVASGDPTKPPVPSGAAATTAGASGEKAGGVPLELAPKVRPGKSLDGVVIQNGGQSFGTAPNKGAK